MAGQADPIRLDFPAETPLAARVEQADAELSDEAAGWPWVLAPASRDCLVAAIETDDLPRANRLDAMNYRLEEQLPVSAEQMLSSYIELPGGRAVGMALDKTQWAPLVEALQQHGRTVTAIVPEALLAARRALAAAGEEIDAVVSAGIEPDDGWDWVRLAEAKPVSWQWWADDRQGLVEAVAGTAAAAGSSIRIVGVGLDASLQDQLAGLEQVDLIGSELSSLQATAAEAGRIVDGRDSAWGDFRGDPSLPPTSAGPMRRAITVATVMLTLLLASLVASGWLMSRRFEDHAAQLAARQAQLYRQTTDSRSVPLNINARLRSELVSLAGLGGSAGGAERPQQQVSALVHLRNILAALPEGIRLRVDQIQIDQDRIRLSGTARNLVEAEQLAVALRDSGLYTVQPPETRAIDARSVRFSFTAETKQQGVGPR
ncbi:MAG: hypothetical protein ACOCZE_09380 [Planctomycetota bacterium]